MSDLEIIHPNHPRGPFRVALWDFDGTLSLYRGGWQRIMLDMMVSELVATGTSESPEVLAAQAEHWIVTLNGKPTIHQMRKLAEEVSIRGGQCRTGEEYCEAYQAHLLSVVDQRIAQVTRGEKQPLDHGVPGVRDMLIALADRGVSLVLASGTELEHVHRELQALGLNEFFGDHVYAPEGNESTFSKRGVIERALRQFKISGEQLVGFGDGMVETAEVKRMGGCAVGIASDEHGGTGSDPDKRRRLIEAGADLIVPHFDHLSPLLQQLGMT